MSEFRFFCIALFISIGGLCALSNRGYLMPDEGSSGIIMLSLALASVATVWFAPRPDRK